MTKPKYTWGQLRRALELCSFPLDLDDSASLGEAYDYLKKNIKIVQSYPIGKLFNKYFSESFYRLSKRKATSIAIFHIKNNIYKEIRRTISRLVEVYDFVPTSKQVYKWCEYGYCSKRLNRMHILPNRWLNCTLSKKQYQEYLEFIEGELHRIYRIRKIKK